MAKKSIADLLRQESQKAPNSEGKSVTNNDNVAIDVPAVEAVEVKVEEEVSSTDKSQIKEATPTKAELEKTIAELKAELEKSQGNEERLEKQIADLKGDLDNQKTLLQEQAKQLEKSNVKKKEFEDAKKISLQLAEANSKLTQDMEELKQQIQQLQQPRQQPIQQPLQNLPVKTPKKFGQPVILPPTNNDDSADFNSNTWLLD